MAKAVLAVLACQIGKEISGATKKKQNMECAGEADKKELTCFLKIVMFVLAGYRLQI
jgi:hypothetical protein